MKTDDPRSFATFLTSIDGGDFERELTEKLAALTTALTTQATNSGGKPKGKLTVAIDLTLDRGLVDVNVDASVKMPKAVRARVVMHPLPSGGLAANNPRQLGLPLEGEPVEVREVPPTELRAI